MQKNWRKCVNIVIAGFIRKIQGNKIRHTARGWGVSGGRSRKRMKWSNRSSSARFNWVALHRLRKQFRRIRIPAFFSSFFFIFLRIYQIFMENIVRFNIFCFHSYRIRIPHSGAKKRKKKTETKSEKNWGSAVIYTHNGKVAKKNIVPEEMKKCWGCSMKHAFHDNNKKNKSIKRREDQNNLTIFIGLLRADEERAEGYHPAD